MSLACRQPLYPLPFNHPHSCVTGMFDLTPPLSTTEHNAVTDSTQVICEQFQQALSDVLPAARAGMLFDEERL